MPYEQSAVKMDKEWANKDRYHPSHGVPEPRMSLPKGKVFVRKVPAWGEKSVVGGSGPAGGVKPVILVLKPVRPVWRKPGGQFGFHARDESRFVAGGRGSGGWSRELAGGEFARRSPPRDQYEFGRGRSFESKRGLRTMLFLSW
jgi:hypothetical protein